MVWHKEYQEFINSRKSFVPPRGNESAKMALVGEQPGTREVQRRKPFVGPAGIELEKCLNESGIVGSDCYYTNTIKDLDLPLKNFIDLSRKSPMVSGDGQLYIQMLKDELLELSPNVVIALGNIALFALCGRKGITSWRGSVVESTLVAGLKVVPTIHPATVIPPKNVYLNRHLIKFDLKRALENQEFSEIITTQRNVKTMPMFDQVMSFLYECKEAGRRGKTIMYDVELSNEEISCISFCYNPIEAMSIPFTHAEGEYFTVEQEAEILLAIAEILEDESIEKGGQNLAFDAHMVLRKYGIKVKNVQDTMIAQKTIMPDYPVGLDFITTSWTDIPYYKKDGKFWLKGEGTWEQGWTYNGYDSLVCAEALPKQLTALKKQNNVAAYERQKSLIPPLVYMQERGIKVDIEGMKNAAKELEKEIEDKQRELNALAGYELNPNSPKQLSQYFYIEKGHKPYTKAGRVTTDDTALKRLIRKGFREAKLVQDIRGAVKRRSTYLSLDKIDPDGRIRCSYNPSGTRYSRISSSKNIFGTGMNMQNWPHALLRYLLFDKGYIGYRFDLSQIENRIVAYVGEVHQMIEAFESGMDLHRLTAALIFSVPYEEVTTDDNTCPIGDGTHSQRFWGKKSNHAFNYGLGYRNFSLQQEIPETEGKWIHGRYHAMYPGVQNTYHAMVRRQLAETRTLTNLFDRKTLFLDQWGDKLFREAYSCIPQGTTGDKINEHGVNFIYYNQQWFEPIELLIQVHDDIGFQVPLSVPWEQHAEMLIRIKNSLETPLRWKNTEFVVPADLTIGLTLHKESGIEVKSKDFPKTSEELSKFLEESYESLKRNHKTVESADTTSEVLDIQEDPLPLLETSGDVSRSADIKRVE